MVNNAGTSSIPAASPAAVPGSVASPPEAVTPAPLPTASSASAAQPVPVQLHYVLPATVAPASTIARDTGLQSGALRHTQYISTANASITITVTPAGGGPTVYGPTPCTTGTCTVNFTANPGPNTIAFSLTNGANVLSQFSIVKIVQPAILNTFNLTANPVVNSVSLSLAAATANAGTAFDDTLTVNALDKSGATIAGPGNYVDVNGNPLALTLNAVNNQNGGRGTVTVKGAARITAPGQAIAIAHYDGGWLDHTTISVNSTRAIAGALTGTTFTTVPAATEYAILPGGSQPYNIVKGPDANLWVTEYGNSKLAKISPAGTLITEYTTLANPHYITVGPDGNLWFTEQTPSDVGRMTTGGSRTDFPITTGSNPVAIVTGPDGALWFAEVNGHNVGRVTTTGNFSYYPSASSNIERGITVGADGNVWYNDSRANTVFSISPLGNISQYGYATGCIVTANDGDGMTLGPDGRVWFVECDDHTIGAVSTAGVVTSYSTGITAGANIRDVYNGPDGNLWFSEENEAQIGRITTAGTVTEYGNGFSGGSTPRGATIGPDGNIWIAEFGSNKVAKFVW